MLLNSIFKHLALVLLISSISACSGGDDTEVNSDDNTNQNQVADTDGDGVNDTNDAFPNDATETVDTDEDGVGDNSDAFPNDATETKDTDEDGVGDNSDAFPNDAAETKDTDEDGVGDNSDCAPTDANNNSMPNEAGLCIEDTANVSINILADSMLAITESSVQITKLNATYSALSSSITTNEEVTTNLFTINLDGEVQPLFDIDLTIVGHFVDAKKQNLYFVPHHNEAIIEQFDCNIFAVNIELSELSCLVSNFNPHAANVNYGFGQVQKWIDEDEDGNLFIVGDKLESSHDINSKVLNTVNIYKVQEELEPLLSDEVDAVINFKAIANSLMISAYDESNLFHGTFYLSRDNDESWSTIKITENIYDVDYVVDPLNTVLLKDGGNLKLIKNSETFDNALFQIPHLKISNESRFYEGDDLRLYNYFEEENSAQLQDIFANDEVIYSKNSLATLNSKNQKLQMSKGYLFYVKEESSSLYGERHVIYSEQMATEKSIAILGDKDTDGISWLDRYRLSYWKLSNDRIYFTGFDDATSSMISGRIDVALLKSGAARSEYLSIVNVDSNIADKTKILDLEVLKPSTSSNFQGGEFRVLNSTLNIENRYFANLEFTKNVDLSTIEDNIQLSYKYKDEDNFIDERTPNLESLHYWYKNNLTVFWDTDLYNSADIINPVPFEADVQIAFDTSKIFDTEGFNLTTVTNSNTTEKVIQYTIRPEIGWALEKNVNRNETVITGYNGLQEYRHGHGFDVTGVLARDIGLVDYKLEFDALTPGDFTIGFKKTTKALVSLMEQ